MKKMLLVGFLFSLVLFGSALGESITFTFANGQITGSGPYYYEFDVMAAASASGTKIGDCLVYINYNSVGFGSNIYTNGKVTVTKGTLTQGELMAGMPLYGGFGGDLGDLKLADNTSSRLAITILYNYEGSPTAANDLPASATQWCHVQIEIADQGESSNLSFQSSLMGTVQYESDNSTNYSPVTASDTDDSSLPVQMSLFTAETSKETGVVISWHTESEVNTTGFDIYRSETDKSSYQKINPAMIPGQGNSSSGYDYSYADRNVRDGVVYWYKVIEIATDGSQHEYGPIRAQGINTVPEEFSLSHSYPNPFNPETTFKYQLAEDSRVTINVYNLMGKRIKQLVREDKPAGYYTETWKGMDENGQRVSSGIYLIYLQAGSFSMTRKITLIR